ncbi:MAG: hypothetical protein ACU0CC_16920 [Sagittula sp.]|jgi:uncharacterized protein YodC (DUF2158 family)|uniref:NADH dehydrogenase subunit C n=1 Tax=Sagittula stellata (strain ATCC 700073 / DSM 11524 / E-37) TaxID=388399 RepID=A3K1C6_SAGS3|nr:MULTISPECIES: hypothetical protein [Sagittula]AUC55098.1 hypothetical protein CDO87_18855 [Sagittula sp. P11]EBA08722.1 NADH dehydrogenase subunit C [Sagittula stellata E-37]WHZ33498.1 hypothetical protein QNI11_12650 [Sagittula sp. MA-2]
MADVKPGDKVQLISGSVVMTVETVGQSDQNAALTAAQCVWYEAGQGNVLGEVRRAVVAVDALEKV